MMTKIIRRRRRRRMESRVCQEIVLVERQRYEWAYKALVVLEIGLAKLVVYF